MFNRIKTYFLVLSSVVGLAITGCKKGTFDINSPNPNVPSAVSPQFTLSAALAATAFSCYAPGFNDFANRYMGYWAFSGDFGGYGTEATYNITTAYGSNNWDYVYGTVLVNYKFIETSSATDPTQAYFLGISKIMQAFHFQRLVDTYGNVPYSDALKGSAETYPKYDDGKTIYTSIIHQVDSAIDIINNANVNTAVNPGKYDIMFGGDMSQWIQFANTLKLKIVMNLTQTADGPALIAAEVGTLTSDDFLGAGQDAAINPGYSNSSAAQQNPQWQNVGFTTGGSDQGGQDFNRANAYAVNFYLNTHDPRGYEFYSLTKSSPTDASATIIHGRAYGSQDGTEHNTVVSAIGPGILKSPSMPAVILPACESLFIQAEAAQRGYITATAGDLYQSAVEESFRLVGVDDPATAAAAYTAQPDTRVNFSTAPDKITLIVTQEWAAMNMYDPLQSWDNWRRLGIPADLPVSIYPGTVASHIPIRLLYPTSEYSNNTANVNAEGTISPITSKIFWMP